MHVWQKAGMSLSVAENGLATQREHLNQLLGRDLSTPFRVDSMPEEDATDLTLDAARDKASQNRPEIRQALLKEKQAEYDRRIAKAEYIPDLSLSVRYQGLNNVKVLPENVGSRRLLFDVGAVRLGTSPQQRGRKKQNGRTGAQRVTRNRIADRGRSRSQVPQVARGRSASQGGPHRTRSGRGAISRHQQ